MGSAGVAEPLLSSLDPAGLPVDQLGDGAPQDMGCGTLDDAVGKNHCQVLLNDQVYRRPGQGPRCVEFCPA